MSLSKFNVTLPTTDNTGAALVAGQITGLLFNIDGATYTYTVPAGTALGATLAVPFASLTPAFALGQANLQCGRAGSRRQRRWYRQSLYPLLDGSARQPITDRVMYC